jgi:hypothetical protein
MDSRARARVHDDDSTEHHPGVIELRDMLTTRIKHLGKKFIYNTQTFVPPITNTILTTTAVST